ncbi:hypothetical protein IWQ60_010728 [Tieghemiomyces parasiticus]|uniref:Uncharacterized protein n=1 Tax=Tieghemiomyces parasiticus TaxID=78921 RepID=A0A9W7ZQ17_9FUNG|nr:hypothetical protein IWQ60_010728 [Tieghemiomyces parasiticus]
MRDSNIHKVLEVESKSISSRTEPWFKKWVSHKSPPDYVERTMGEIENDEREDAALDADFEWLEFHPPVAGEDEAERLEINLPVAGEDEAERLEINLPVAGEDEAERLEINLPVAGEDEADRLVREQRLPRRVLAQDYRILRDTYLDDGVRDDDITAIREYMQDTIWPAAKPLVEAILYRQLLHRTLLNHGVTPLGNVYAKAQVSSYPSYPHPSEENVEGVTIVSAGDFAAYRPGVEAAISNPGDCMNTFLPRAIREFRPELLKINDAVRLIKFNEIYATDKDDPALHFPLALLLGDIRYLNSLQQVLVRNIGMYGVMDILHKGSAIPTGHLQFMEFLANRQVTRSAVDKARLGDEDPTLAQVKNQMQRNADWRTFRNVGSLYERKVLCVLRQSIVVAFAALGMVGHLDAYINKRDLDGKLRFRRPEEPGIAILVADRLKRPDHVDKIQSWYGGLSDSEICHLKGSGLYLGWEPRTESVKCLVQRCKDPKPKAYFINDLPVYIGADDKLYFLTYDSMVTTEPTTLQ